MSYNAVAIIIRYFATKAAGTHTHTRSQKRCGTQTNVCIVTICFFAIFVACNQVFYCGFLHFRNFFCPFFPFLHFVLSFHSACSGERLGGSILLAFLLAFLLFANNNDIIFNYSFSIWRTNRYSAICFDNANSVRNMRPCVCVCVCCCIVAAYHHTQRHNAPNEAICRVRAILFVYWFCWHSGIC